MVNIDLLLLLRCQDLLIHCLRHISIPYKIASDGYMHDFCHQKDLHSGDKMSSEIHLHTWKPMMLLQNISYMSEH
jgi:hypothetical protein